MRKYILSFLVLAVLLVGLWGAHHVISYGYSPIHKPGEEKIIQIQKGWSFAQVASELQEEGVIEDTFWFKVLARVSGKMTTLKAGEYRVHTEWSRMELLRHLEEGKELLHRVSIPEGSTWWEVARIVDNSGLAEYQEVAEQVEDQELLDRYNIAGDTAEGFLFPETYHFSRQRANASHIVETMLQQFWKQAEENLWPEDPPGEERLYRVVTLASMVERETGVPQERPRIAGVFKNRLQRQMLLQCDPTVIYGLGPDFVGNLRRKHLRDEDNPYNTYQHPGLPPSPIASPGLESIEAVLSPEEHDYLYFVSRGNGTHKFSRTLQEHNKAVRKYQLGQ